MQMSAKNSFYIAQPNPVAHAEIYFVHVDFYLLVWKVAATYRI